MAAVVVELWNIELMNLSTVRIPLRPCFSLSLLSKNQLQTGFKVTGIRTLNSVWFGDGAQY